MAQRSYLLLLLCGCFFLGVARWLAGGTALHADRVEISFWNGWTGPDGQAMLSVIRRFNEQNPDALVSMQRMDWATYYNKLMVAETDGRGPQVFVIHASTLPRMRRADFLADVTDLYGKKTGIFPSDFDPQVLNQVKFGKDMVGLPLDIHPQGLYCNADALKAAKLVNSDGSPRPPSNKVEFIQAIEAMQKIAKDGSHDVWGFSLTMWRNNFMSLMPQFHGHCFDAAGNPDLVNKGNVAALQFLGDLMNKYKLAPPAEINSGWDGFREKRVAMVWEGVYMIGDLQRLEDLHYVGAPLPTVGDQPGTLADSHVLCMRKDLSRKEREVVERFIVFLSKNSLEWAKAGQVPARKSIRNTPEFRALQAQYQFSRQIPWMLYPPRTPILFELQLEIDLAVEKVLRGRATPLEALTAANEKVKEALQRDREENKF